MEVVKENLCIQTGMPCGVPCYHLCPHYNDAFKQPNQLITEGNYDEKVHGYLKTWRDAFGNLVAPSEGYYLLQNNAKINVHDKIQEGDLHFDIYGGWTDGHGSDYNGRNVLSEGRWRAWARKI